MFAELATEEPDPVELASSGRERRCRPRRRRLLRSRPRHCTDYTQFAPPAVAARAMRMVSRLRIADRMNPPFNLVISNVPGPNYPLYLAGAKLEHFYPISALIDGQGLNITVQSYNGNLDFGFIADRKLVPDVWRLTELLEDSFEELLEVS